MFYVPIVPADGAPVVFGASVAGREFTRAVIRSPALDCALFAAPPALETARNQVHAYRRFQPSKRAVSVHSMVELSDGKPLDELAITAWHDINADVRRPFELRATYAKRAFPITITHHTFSYSTLLYDWFLPLLLGDVQSFDSLICTSTAARDAIGSLLEHVAEGFNRTHGTRLAFRGRLDLIPLGVDTELFRPRDRKDARAQVGLPIDSFIYLWLGRLSAEDKADLLPLLKVFASICRHHPHKKPLMVIAGSNVGDSAKIIAEYAQSLGISASVVLRDRVPDNTHWLHASADVFVAPTDNIQEAFGLAPLEAMAAGIPQIVTDWNGYRDTVVHAVTGFRIPTTWFASDGDLSDGSAVQHWRPDHLALAQSVVVDLDALYNAMEALLTTPELCRAMGQASRQRAVEVFDWSVVLRGYSALWSELAAMSRSSKVAPRMRPYLHAPYHRVFHGYPTHWLAGGEKIRLTVSGQNVRQGREGLPTYFPNLLDAGLVDEVFHALADTTCSLSVLEARLSRVSAIPKARVRRHLLWLLKYGFAETVAKKSNPSIIASPS